MANTSNSGGNCFLIGCSSLGGIALLATLAANGAGGLALLLVIAGIVISIVLSNRRKQEFRALPPAELPRLDLRVDGVPSSIPAAQSIASMGEVPKDEFATSICVHSFSAQDLKGNETVVCPCGYVFSTQLLKDYAKLRRQVIETQAQLDKTWQSLQAIKNKPRSQYTQEPVLTPQPSVAASAPARSTVVEPVRAPVQTAPAAPVKQVAKRKKVTLAPQQWLIFGASILIAIATSVFINVQVAAGSPPWFYLTVTIPLAIASGFAAFWGRKISVILANFMATFSSAMQIASFLVLATILVDGTQVDFEWNSAPAWWWGTDLLIVSVIAWFLARFKANFGWKVIALVGFVISVQMFAFGPITDAFPLANGQVGFFAAINVAAAVVLALMSKSLRGYKFEVKESLDAEYEADLAKREQAALQRFTLVAASALAFLGTAYTLNGFALTLFEIEPISFSVFALTWVIAGAFQSKWVPGLTENEALQARINRIEHIVGFTSLALALNAWINLITNPWLTAAGTVALTFVASVLATKIKRVSDHPLAITIAHFSLVISWAIWYLQSGLVGSNSSVLGLVLVGFALSLVLKQWFKFETSNSISATTAHAIGLAVLAYNLRTASSIENTSALFAVAALGLILLLALYSPITAIIAKRHEAKQSSQWHIGIAIVTGLLTLLLSVPFDAKPGSEYLNIILMLGVSSLSVGVVSQLAKGKLGEFRGLLNSYSYIFQGALVLVLLMSTKSTADLPFVASALLLLALVNFALAWLGKERIRGFVAYGLGLVGVLLLSNNLQERFLPWSHLLIILGIIGLINLIQFFVAKRVDAKHPALLTSASLLLGTLLSVFSNYSRWQSGSLAVVGLIELVVISIIFVALAERKVTDSSKQLLRANGLLYLVIAYSSFATMSDLNSNRFQQILLAVLFSLIVLRQLVQVSKSENKTVINGWFALAHLGPVAASLLLNLYLLDNFGDTGLATELYGLPLAFALALPTYFNRSISKESRAITGLDIPVMIMVGLQLSKGIVALNTSDSALNRIAIVLLLAAAFAYWRSVAEKRIVWVYLGYVTGGLGALVGGHILQTRLLTTYVGPELYTVPLALSLLVGAFFLIKRVDVAQRVRNIALIDAPVLAPLAISVVYSVNLGFTQERLLISLLLLSIFTYWRSVAEKQLAWVVVGYVTGALASLSAANLIQTRLLANVFYPESYTVPLALSLVVGSVFLAKRIELRATQLQLARVDLPVLIPVLVSVGYSLSQGLDQTSNLLRLVLSLAFFTGYTYFKLSKQKTLIWAVSGYLSLVGNMLALVRLVTIQKWFSFDGPEIYSVAIAIAVFLGNLQLKKVVEFKTSLLTSGLPLLALLLPSIVQSYTVLDKQFGELTVLEISRVVLVLLIALVALVLGVRQGNLGATVVGGSALALVVLPISWVRAGDAETLDVQVSIRSLVIAAVLFILFAALRRAEKLPDNSYIYLGLPVAVALGPSLFLTIQALGQTELRQVDWWRFGIIVVVSLVLLVVGALRNLGGMFFPGLVGVLVGVLPYAFKPIASQSWFLWVVLLVIAGIMVWIAVRLEQLRKLGKSSVSWVKALK